MKRMCLASASLALASVVALADARDTRAAHRVETVKLNPSADSSIRAKWMSLTRFADGSQQIDGELVGSSAARPRTVHFTVDISAMAYKAELKPTSPESLAVLEAALRAVKDRERSSQSKPPKAEPKLPEDPPDPCCVDLCGGHHSALISTVDLVGIPLVTTVHSSAWDVYEGYQGNCRWESYGYGSCNVEQQNITYWYMTNWQGSYPNGAYKLVNHWTDCDFQNYDWHNVNYPTGTGHTIQIYRSAGSPNPSVTFSHWAGGEDYFLLGFDVSDSGSNDCY